MTHRLSLLIATAICILLAACTQSRQPCLTPTIATLIVESIHLPTDTSTTAIDTGLPGAVFIPWVPGKTTLSGTIYPLQSTFSLSLSPDSTICSWILTSDSLVHAYQYNYDTLTFFYQRNLKFLSNACGFTYFYTLDSVHTSHHIIDSVHLLNPSVTNDVNTKHLQIYIHPDY